MLKKQNKTKLISLGIRTAHNTDPPDRPNEYKENVELTPGRVWSLKSGSTVENDKYHLLVLSNGICLHCADPSAGQGQ